MLVEPFAKETGVRFTAKSCYRKENHIKFLVKKALQETVVQNSSENLLLRKHRVKTFVKTLQYTDNGGSTVSSSLWKLVRVEMLVVR